MGHYSFVLFVFFCISLVAGSSLVGIYQPDAFYTSLKFINTINGSFIPNSDIKIPLQPNDYYSSGGTYDSVSHTYSYSISENGATVTVVNILTKEIQNVTLPCSPKCGIVWTLTSYNGKVYGYATTPKVGDGFVFSSLFAFSLDLQKFTVAGFWYTIPAPYFIWVWGNQIGVSVVNGKTNIYTVLFNTTNPTRIYPTFAHFTTITLETETVNIQSYISSSEIQGYNFQYDYSDGSLWVIRSDGLVKLDISNPTVTTAATVYSSIYPGYSSNSVLDLKNQFYYALVEGVMGQTTFLSYNLATKQNTTVWVFGEQNQMSNLCLID